MRYNRSFDDLERNAVLWWPENLSAQDASMSIIPRLLKSQDDFLRILSLSRKSPFQVFDIIQAAKFPVNLFLKHLCILADYGGEPIQRLGRSFTNIFEETNERKGIAFSWKGNNYNYIFQALPVKGLGNSKLLIDGSGLSNEIYDITPLYRDVIMLLMFGASSNVSEEAGLAACEIGNFLGEDDALIGFVKQRYIMVSRITGGATANSLGQLAQKQVIEYLKGNMGQDFHIVSNGIISLHSYKKILDTPFDIVVSRNNDKRKIGIEISFQVTTNSTIERKAGQASDRLKKMNKNGHHIAYIIDGAGNFQRKSAVSTICGNSECTVAYNPSEFDILIKWINSIYD